MEHEEDKRMLFSEKDLFGVESYIHSTRDRFNWLSVTGRVAHFSRIRGSHSPEQWLNLTRIIYAFSNLGRDKDSALVY